MITRSKIVIALALTFGASGVALANTGSHRGKAEMIQKFDANKDGKLDDTEAAAMKAAVHARHAEMKAKRLAQFDTNRDGKLDDTERRVMHQTRQAERFKTLDTNHDGQISSDEFKAANHGRRGHHGRGHGTQGGPRTK